MPRLLLAGAALGLFLMWSNSFVAVGYLVGSDGAPARLDWVGLAVARFLPIAPLAAGYCFVFRRRAALAALRGHPWRLAAGGLLAVPGYNCALYWGQQRGVPAPVASLTTALLPLMLMALAAVFLGERMTRRRLVGLAVSLAGMLVIAGAARDVGGAGGYGAAVAVTALAPLSWSLFSLLSKPVAGRVPPLVWTYLAIAVGSLPLVAVAPFRGGPELLALDLPGAVAVAYLSLPCTLLGFAVWTWLLKHLPASTVGFTVFLNPPLTTLSKATLAALVPGTFLFTITAREWLGGVLALAGLAIALWGPRPGGAPARPKEGAA